MTTSECTWALQSFLLLRSLAYEVLDNIIKKKAGNLTFYGRDEMRNFAVWWEAVCNVSLWMKHHLIIQASSLRPALIVCYCNVCLSSTLCTLQRFGKGFFLIQFLSRHIFFVFSKRQLVPQCGTGTSVPLFPSCFILGGRAVFQDFS